MAGQINVICAVQRHECAMKCTVSRWTWAWSVVEWYLWGKTDVLKGKHVPGWHRWLQLSHWLSWDQTWASVGRNWPVTIWVTTVLWLMLVHESLLVFWHLVFHFVVPECQDHINYVSRHESSSSCGWNPGITNKWLCGWQCQWASWFNMLQWAFAQPGPS